MVRVGVHVSIAGGIRNAVDRARQAGCDTFQVFSRNPRGWAYPLLGEEDVREFRDRLETSGIGPVFDHMPYLPNLASPKEEIYAKSVATLTAEITRCGTLGVPFLVTHLGHHLGDGAERGRERVVSALNTAVGTADADDVTVLLENTAGEKNSVGSRLEDLRSVWDGIREKERFGFCFDTCHAYAAGYDLTTPDGLRDTLTAFDTLIGLDRIRLIHLNDCKGGLGSGLDRHEHIGLGSIGSEGFTTILAHPLFRRLPLICETPVDERRDDKGNIRVVRVLASADHS